LHVVLGLGLVIVFGWAAWRAREGLATKRLIAVTGEADFQQKPVVR